MKKIKILAMLSLCLFLTACDGSMEGDNISAEPQTSQDIQSESKNTDNTTSTPGEVTDTPEVKLPVEKDENDLFGIAFLGYEGAISPPYSYISEEQFKQMESVMHEGDEYYLIVPTSDDVKVDIFAFESNDPIGGIGDYLYQSDSGVPILLRCNLSDIHTNTMIRFEYDDLVVSYSPKVDLIDSSVVIEDGGYLLDILESEAKEKNTTELNYETILIDVVGEDYLSGRALMRVEDEEIFGDTFAVFKVGTHTEETFTTEEWLAVNGDGMVCQYDVATDKWALVQSDVNKVDYSPYSALLKAYELDYNAENLSATDYVVTGMTTTPTYPESNGAMVNTSGLCYANLVDLDYNGILELVIIAYDEQEYGDYDSFYSEEEVYIEDLKYPNIIKLYTILPNSGLEFLGSLPVSYLQTSVSSHYGIEYIVSDDKTYIQQSEIFQMGNGEISYFGYSDGFFGVEAFHAFDIDGARHFEGGEISGESEKHFITNLNDSYLDKLESINKETFDFLKNYPVRNFESYRSAYNNGQFYFAEYELYDYFPANHVIENYYKALTMRDYDTLEELIGSEDVDSLKKTHTGEISTYVPGYIISDLGQAILEDIENSDMANDIASFVEKVDADEMDNLLVMKCIVNEVLDPHTTALGLQVAGGMYETYFVLSSEDPIYGDWKIEEIFDDKFYW